MKEVRFHKADRIVEDVTPVTIIIDQELHQSELGIDEIENTFRYDAQNLASALFNSLPQGTLDILLITLMKRKVSVYRGITRS